VDREKRDALVRHVNEPLGALLGVDHVRRDTGDKDDSDQNTIKGIQKADSTRRTPLKRKFSFFLLKLY